jgi:hypothetical protein
MEENVTGLSVIAESVPKLGGGSSFLKKLASTNREKTVFNIATPKQDLHSRQGPHMMLLYHFRKFLSSGFPFFSLFSPVFVTLF